MIVQPRHQIGGYREFAPSPDAAFFADAFWTHQTPNEPLPQGAAHRVLPDLAVSVAFQAFRDDAGRVCEGGPILIGPKLRPQVFRIVPGLELTAVRINAEWAAPMLGIDPFDIELRVMDLAELRPGLAAMLRDALWRTRSATEVIAVLSRTLIHARVSQAAPSAWARAALDVVRRTDGRIPCERVASRVGISLRHLRRHVHDATGVSPKTYARTLRLVTSMRLADGAARPAWSDIALQAGYYDQSHLIRECLAMTGSSPVDLHEERRRQVLRVSELSNRA
jgi:AraC-like DNA-binding protein